MFSLQDLIITQESLRNEFQLIDMVRFAKRVSNRGLGLFTRNVLDRWATIHGKRPSPLIQISRFEDGKMYIVDGHHRCCAIQMSERAWLDGTEYEVTDWRYDDYYEPNFENNWYTPFDPRTEVRKPDFREIKKKIEERSKTKYIGCADDMIRMVSRDYRYKAPRTITSVAELMRLLGGKDKEYELPTSSLSFDVDLLVNQDTNK